MLFMTFGFPQVSLCTSAMVTVTAWKPSNLLKDRKLRSFDRQCLISEQNLKSIHHLDEYLILKKQSACLINSPLNKLQQLQRIWIQIFVWIQIFGTFGSKRGSYDLVKAKQSLTNHPLPEQPPPVPILAEVANQ